MFRKDKRKIDKDADLKIVDPTNRQSILSEQYRTIRTNIKYSMIDANLKSFLVTSANPNAGKTFNAANLATTFAYDDKKVLLVDTDLRKPTLHRTFNASNLRGLTTLLAERDMEIEEAIFETTVDNLSILPSGPIPPNPSELLDTKRMDAIIEDLEEYYDLIIFDTPPLYVVTDAQVLSTKVDGVIFIIYANKATKDKVSEAIDLLNRVDANIIGAIFNGVENKKENYYYYAEE